MINVTIQENKAPIADIEIDQLESSTFQAITFDGSGSYDPDGNVQAFYFDFGDGNSSSWINNSIITYSFSRPGSYTCSLKVRDNHGAESQNVIEKLILITWHEQPPVITNVSINPKDPVCSEEVELLVDAYDLNLDELEYFYYPVQGIIDGTGSSVTWNASEKPGTYKINIRVFDGKFSSPNWTLFIPVIENHPPSIIDINCTSNKINPGDSVNISVNAVDIDGHELQYEFKSDSGEIIQNHSKITWVSPEETGIYIIQINVSDSRGGFNNKETFIAVGESNPSTLIRSFEIIPDNIYLNERTEILIELTLNNKFLSLIEHVNVNLSVFNDGFEQELFDIGTNGDVTAEDGIYSCKLYVIKKDSAGEYQIWASITTTIPDLEFNVFSAIKVQERSTENGELWSNIYAGLTIIILIMIIILFILLKKRKDNNSQKEIRTKHKKKKN
jgi:PKD repeat protein